MSLSVVPFIVVVSTFVPLSAHNKWYQSIVVVFGGIVKVWASSTIRRAHNRVYSLENQFSRIVFLSYIQINYCKWPNHHDVDRECGVPISK